MTAVKLQMLPDINITGLKEAFPRCCHPSLEARALFSFQRADRLRSGFVNMGHGSSVERSNMLTDLLCYFTDNTLC